MSGKDRCSTCIKWNMDKYTDLPSAYLRKDQNIYRFVGIFLPNIYQMRICCSLVHARKKSFKKPPNFSSLQVGNWLQYEEVPVKV